MSFYSKALKCLKILLKHVQKYSSTSLKEKSTVYKCEFYSTADCEFKFVILLMVLLFSSYITINSDFQCICVLTSLRIRNVRWTLKKISFSLYT